MISRNTDADWEDIAQVEPYFGVLSEPKFLMENLTDEARDEFFERGVSDIDFILAQPEFAERPRHLAYDFGCGVGRLSTALARHFDRVVGIDVSPSMRRIARENAERMNLRNVEYVADIPSEMCDLVVSPIVFQHIKPAIGLRLLDNLLAVSRATAIQITFYRTIERLHELARDASMVSYDGDHVEIVRPSADQDGGMTMYDYHGGQVLSRFFENGFDTLRLGKTDHGGHIGAWILARRG